MHRQPEKHRYLDLLLALALPIGLSGCVAVVAAGAAGMGIVQYQKNETTREFSQGVDEVWSAATQAMEQLGYGPPLTEEIDPMEATGQWKDKSDGIRIRMESRPGGGTQLIVRVGKFDTKDHRRKALVILSETSGVLDGEEELREWSLKVQSLSGEGETEAGTASEGSPDD